jgi:hypothetical protein
MRNLIIVAAIIFALALAFPGDRNTIVIALFSLFAGIMLGARYGGKHYAELMANRAERMATPANSHAVREESQWQTE